jgi:hypothetical protein
MVLLAAPHLCSGQDVVATNKLNLCWCCALLLQAERLSWHPSILTWCGNNELELSYEWANNTFIRSNRNMFVNDYMTNIRTLRRAIKKVWCYVARRCCGRLPYNALHQFSLTATLRQALN